MAECHHSQIYKITVNKTKINTPKYPHCRPIGQYIFMSFGVVDKSYYLCNC